MCCGVAVLGGTPSRVEAALHIFEACDLKRCLPGFERMSWFELSKLRGLEPAEETDGGLQKADVIVPVPQSLLGRDVTQGITPGSRADKYTTKVKVSQVLQQLFWRSCQSSCSDAGTGIEGWASSLPSPS